MNRQEAYEFLKGYLDNEFHPSNDYQTYCHLRDCADVLAPPQPDPDTGLAPCGCGGKATRSYSSIGCVVFCSTCGCTTKSVFFASEAVKVWNTAMGWKGGAE